MFWKGSHFAIDKQTPFSAAIKTAIKLQYEINALQSTLHKTNPEDESKIKNIKGLIKERTVAKKTYTNIKKANDLMKMYLGLKNAHTDNFDKRPELINLNNGTFDIEKQEFREHRQSDYLTQIIPIAYTPSADCPKFKAFIKDICCNDQELINYLQMAIGYSFTGYNDEQVMFFPFGNGANGKSLLLHVLETLLSRSYAASTSIETLTEVKNRGIATDLMRLRNKRFVVASESNTGVPLDEGRVKLVTGDDTVVARNLYGPEQEFVMIAKFWFMTNELPVIRGKSDGIQRRIKVIPFNASFKDPEEMQVGDKKKDRKLKDKLLNELPGILNWVLEGAMKWRKEGKLPSCTAVQLATDQYLQKCDTVQRFLSAHTEQDIGFRVQALSLHEAYISFCESNGLKALNIKAFKMQMENKGFQSIKSSGVMQWKDLKLLASLVQSKAS